MTRRAGRLAAEVLSMVEAYVAPGVSTETLDQICHEHIVNVRGAIPANVGYHGYPKTILTSVNQVVCHGIPSADKILTSSTLMSPLSRMAGSATPVACTSSAPPVCWLGAWWRRHTKHCWPESGRLSREPLLAILATQSSRLLNENILA